jgi:hypothetical protein
MSIGAQTLGEHSGFALAGVLDHVEPQHRGALPEHEFVVAHHFFCRTVNAVDLRVKALSASTASYPDFRNHPRGGDIQLIGAGKAPVLGARQGSPSRRRCAGPTPSVSVCTLIAAIRLRPMEIRCSVASRAAANSTRSPSRPPHQSMAMRHSVNRR